MCASPFPLSDDSHSPRVSRARAGFPNTVDSPPARGSKPCELTQTIRTLRNALKPNGRVFFRSAGQEPWYLELYRREGFKVECIHKRPIGGKIPIDRVNM